MVSGDQQRADDQRTKGRGMNEPDLVAGDHRTECNRRDDQQNGNECIINQGLESQSEFDIYPCRKNAADEFNDGVAKRDAFCAVAALSFQYKVAENRYIVVKTDQGPASGAHRTRVDNRFGSRQSVNAHI